MRVVSILISDRDNRCSVVIAQSNRAARFLPPIEDLFSECHLSIMGFHQSCVKSIENWMNEHCYHVVVFDEERKKIVARCLLLVNLEKIPTRSNDIF